MSALTDAQAALSAATTTYETARSAADEARARAVGTRAQVTGGNTAGLTAADLATADQEAEFTALAAAGLLEPLAALGEAVAAAQTDATADDIMATLPGLGADVVTALDTVAADIGALVVALQRYDGFVDQSVRSLQSMGTSPRVNVQRHGTTTVDRVPIATCRPASQLAAAMFPALRTLRAPNFALEQLQLLASAAPTIPTA